MKKVVSVIAMCSLLFLVVPPLSAQQQNVTKPPTCPPACNGGLDPVYGSTNQTVMGVWNKRVGTKTVPPITDLATIQTALSLSYSHAQSTGNNAAANAQKVFVANIDAELSNPSATLVAEIQKAMKNYNGMAPSNAAVAQWLESIAKDPQLPTVVGLYNSGGIEAVENKANSMLNTLIADQSKPGLTYASNHSGRLLLVEDEFPSFWELFALVAGFIGAVFAVAVAFGCAECDGAAAVSGLEAATVALLSGLGIDGSTWNPGPWVDGGGNCDPCDTRQKL